MEEEVNLTEVVAVLKNAIAAPSLQLYLCTEEQVKRARDFSGHNDFIVLEQSASHAAFDGRLDSPHRADLQLSDTYRSHRILTHTSEISLASALSNMLTCGRCACRAN